MPFDQFTVEQLAGDLLPNADPDADASPPGSTATRCSTRRAASTRWSSASTRWPTASATTGTVWLGLTLGCAQCHTHKFDPITHREYYRLFAFLNNADEPEIDRSRRRRSDRSGRRSRRRSAKLVAELPAKFPKGADADAAFARLARGGARQGGALADAPAGGGDVEPAAADRAAGRLGPRHRRPDQERRVRARVPRRLRRGDGGPPRGAAGRAPAARRAGARRTTRGRSATSSSARSRPTADGKPVKFGEGVAHVRGRQVHGRGRPSTATRRPAGRSTAARAGAHVAVFALDKPLDPAERADGWSCCSSATTPPASAGSASRSRPTRATPTARDMPRRGRGRCCSPADDELTAAQRTALREHFLPDDAAAGEGPRGDRRRSASSCRRTRRRW